MVFVKEERWQNVTLFNVAFSVIQMLTAGANVSPRFIWVYLLLKETRGRILMTSGTEHFTLFIFLFATFHRVSSRKDNVDNRIDLFSNRFIIFLL